MNRVVRASLLPLRAAETVRLSFYGNHRVQKRRRSSGWSVVAMAKASDQSGRQKSIWGNPAIPSVCDSSPQWYAS
jgi:hypothetical protein